MKILDLFAGIGGELRRKDIERLGHSYTTLDINPDFKCDITADIMTLKPGDLGVYDFIWASPPCETWSVASIGHHWSVDNTPKTVSAKNGILLMLHTIEIIKSSATIWLIENPRGKLRKMPFMQDFNRKTVTYCQYGDNRMKPTDLWISGFNWNPRPMCKNGDPCHERARRGTKAGTQGMKSYEDKSVVPLALWLEVLDAIQSDEPSFQMSIWDYRSI